MITELRTRIAPEYHWVWLPTKKIQPKVVPSFQNARMKRVLEKQETTPDLEVTQQVRKDPPIVTTVLGIKVQQMLWGTSPST